MGDETESTGTEMVPVAGRIVTKAEIEAAGFGMPLADPAALKAAFAERQRVLTSILDPNHDFLYTIRYFDREGNQRNIMAQTLDEAKKQVAHLGNGASFSAHPKKSGVIKLAHALGIESRQVEVSGLPKDPKATWSSCRYIARHRRTGHEEEGQGYCDTSEKPNQKMKAHAIISMADTRAYCHAVLRCAGYDNVGAESLDVHDEDGAVTIQSGMSPMIVNERALPAQTVAPTMTEALGDAPPKREPAPVTVVAPAASTAAAAAAAATEPLPPAPVPDTAPLGGVITNAMAGELSALLVAKLGSKPKASEWLKTNAGVERSIHVREDQVGDLKKKLEAMETP